MSTLHFNAFVAGIPKGQPRPRAFSRGGHARVYNPATAEGWKSSVVMQCIELKGRMLDGALSVELNFQMPRPKSHTTPKGVLRKSAPTFWHTNTPDIDNLVKAVLDALSEIGAWGDDRQVAVLVIRKTWAEPGKPSGCRVRIESATTT